MERSKQVELWDKKQVLHYVRGNLRLSSFEPVFRSMDLDGRALLHLDNDIVGNALVEWRDTEEHLEWMVDLIMAEVESLRTPLRDTLGAGLTIHESGDVGFPSFADVYGGTEPWPEWSWSKPEEVTRVRFEGERTRRTNEEDEAEEAREWQVEDPLVATCMPERPTGGQLLDGDQQFMVEYLSDSPFTRLVRGSEVSHELRDFCSEWLHVQESNIRWWIDCSGPWTWLRDVLALGNALGWIGEEHLHALETTAEMLAVSRRIVQTLVNGRYSHSYRRTHPLSWSLCLYRLCFDTSVAPAERDSAEVFNLLAEVAPLMEQTQGQVLVYAGMHTDTVAHMYGTEVVQIKTLLTKPSRFIGRLGQDQGQGETTGSSVSSSSDSSHEDDDGIAAAEEALESMGELSWAMEQGPLQGLSDEHMAMVQAIGLVWPSSLEEQRLVEGVVGAGLADDEEEAWEQLDELMALLGWGHDGAGLLLRTTHGLSMSSHAWGSFVATWMMQEGSTGRLAVRVLEQSLVRETRVADLVVAMVYSGAPAHMRLRVSVFSHLGWLQCCEQAWSMAVRLQPGTASAKLGDDTLPMALEEMLARVHYHALNLYLVMEMPHVALQTSRESCRQLDLMGMSYEGKGMLLVRLVRAQALLATYCSSEARDDLEKVHLCMQRLRKESKEWSHHALVAWAQLLVAYQASQDVEALQAHINTFNEAVSTRTNLSTQAMALLQLVHAETLVLCWRTWFGYDLMWQTVTLSRRNDTWSGVHGEWSVGRLHAHVLVRVARIALRFQLGTYTRLIELCQEAVLSLRKVYGTDEVRAIAELLQVECELLHANHVYSDEVADSIEHLVGVCKAMTVDDRSAQPALWQANLLRARHLLNTGFVREGFHLMHSTKVALEKHAGTQSDSGHLLSIRLELANAYRSMGMTTEAVAEAKMALSRAQGVFKECSEPMVRATAKVGTLLKENAEAEQAEAMESRARRILHELLYTLARYQYPMYTSIDVEYTRAWDATCSFMRMAMGMESETEPIAILDRCKQAIQNGVLGDHSPRGLMRNPATSKLRTATGASSSTSSSVSGDTHSSSGASSGSSSSSSSSSMRTLSNIGTNPGTGLGVIGRGSSSSGLSSAVEHDSELMFMEEESPSFHLGDIDVVNVESMMVVAHLLGRMHLPASLLSQYLTTIDEVLGLVAGWEGDSMVRVRIKRNLAASLHAQGRISSALTVYQEAYDMTRRVRKADDDLERLEILRLWVKLLVEARDYTRAELLCEEVLLVHHKVVKEKGQRWEQPHAKLLLGDTMLSCAVVLFELNKLTQVESALREAMRSLGEAAKKLPPAKVRLMEAQRWQALLLGRTGKFEQGNMLMDTVLNQLASMFLSGRDTGAEQMYDAYQMWARMKIGARDLEGAVDKLLQLEDAQLRDRGETGPRMTYSMLGNVYAELGDTVKAEAYHMKAVNAYRRHYGDTQHPETADAMFSLAKFLLSSKRDQNGAKAWLRSAYQIRLACMGPDNSETKQTLSLLETLQTPQERSYNAMEAQIVIYMSTLANGEADMEAVRMHKYLALLMLKQGDVAVGITHCRRALDLLGTLGYTEAQRDLHRFLADRLMLLEEFRNSALQYAQLAKLYDEWEPMCVALRRGTYPTGVAQLPGEDALEWRVLEEDRVSYGNHTIHLHMSEAVARAHVLRELGRLRLREGPPKGHSGERTEAMNEALRQALVALELSYELRNHSATMKLLVNTLLQVGEESRARELCQDSVAVADEVVGAQDHPRRVEATRLAGDLLVEHDSTYELGWKYLEQAMEMQTVLTGAVSEEVAQLHHRMAEVLMHRGNLQEGMKHAMQQKQIREQLAASASEAGAASSTSSSTSSSSSSGPGGDQASTQATVQPGTMSTDKGKGSSGGGGTSHSSSSSGKSGKKGRKGRR